MKIKVLELIEGAKQAEGLTVIIDVFRAFSVEAYLMNRKVGTLYACGDKELAYRYRDEHPGTILVGERKGIILPGFDYGNSPSAVDNDSIEGKTVVHTTSAGTQGIANAVNASEIVVASLVNARAVVEYIKRKNPETVSIVAMGLAGTKSSEEDVLCAKYMKELLLGNELDIKDEIEDLKNTAGAKFFDPARNHIFPEADFYYSTDLNHFDFVIKAEDLHNGYFHMTLAY